MTPFDRDIIWHVIFHPGPCLWGKYRHVSLAGFANDTWLNLDLQRSGVRIAPIYHHDEARDYLTYLLAHFTVLRVGPSRPDARHFLAPMTCVSFVKHALGTRSSALRPDSLFRDLVRNYSAEVLSDAFQARGNA